MNTCIIFGAAAFDRLAEPICPGDFIIAADGGLRHTKKLSIIPNEILGDFDSLGYVPETGVVYPVEKDAPTPCWPSAGGWNWASGGL